MCFFFRIEPVSIIRLSLNETCLKEGSTVSLHCDTRGFPRPRIEFRQDGIEIITGAEPHSNVLMEYYDQACDHAWHFIDYIVYLASSYDLCVVYHSSII